MDGINWLGHASFVFKIKTEIKFILLTLFELGERKLEKARSYFITHAHYDHFSQGDIDKIIKDESIIIAPPDILALISIDETRKIKIEPNQSYDVKNFKFSTIPHTITDPDAKKNTQGVITGSDIFLNSTARKFIMPEILTFTEEMKTLKELNLDVAMLPMGGSFTMDADDMIEAANWIGAKITIQSTIKSFLEGCL